MSHFGHRYKRFEKHLRYTGWGIKAMFIGFYLMVKGLLIGAYFVRRLGVELIRAYLS